MLETPTWRANPDWGDQLGYDRRGLDRVNQSSVELLAEMREATEGGVDDMLGGCGTDRRHVAAMWGLLMTTAGRPAPSRAGRAGAPSV